MKNNKMFSQSDLLQLLHDDEINPNGCTRKKLLNCIDLLKGNNLKLERRGEHGKKFYRWNPM
jgi:hypothetical protein